MEATIARQAEETAAATNTLEIAENPATGILSAGTGRLVNFLAADAQARRQANGFGGKSAGKRKPGHIRRLQAEDFANTAHSLLLNLRSQLGLPQAREGVQPPSQASGHATNGKNREQACESDSRQSARAELKEAAGILVNLTRGWDTALERSRVERGVPDPGCRRPGEPIPKARKPTNRAPDSLACGVEVK